MAVTDNAYAGFPLACFPRDSDGKPIPPLPFNPYDASWRRFAAQILCEQYSDPLLAYNRLRAELPAAWTLKRVDNSSATVPGTLIGGNGLHSVTFVSGTTTAYQLGTQAFESLLPPTDFGGYLTFPLWNSAAIVIANRIQLAALDQCPHATFIGHSYGGAVAEVLAFLCARADPTRTVFLLTFGAPPAGRIPAAGPYPNNIVPAAILNDGDPVGFFPPPSPFLEWAFPIIGADTYVYWKLWKPSRGVLRLRKDGVARYDDTLTVPWLDMAAFIVQAATHVPIDPGSDHYMPEYVRRLWSPFVPPTPCGDL